jgi:hypothetical protein
MAMGVWRLPPWRLRRRIYLAVAIPVALLAGVLGGESEDSSRHTQAKRRFRIALHGVLNYIAPQFFTFCLRVLMLDPAKK